MNILYIIETIVFFILLLLVKKSDNKLNILKHAIIMVFVIMCYNFICSAILSIFKIPVSLLNIVIGQAILILVCLIKILIDRKIQKYEISIKDIIFLILAICIVTAVNYKAFGKLDQLSYVTTDASVHFNTSKEFYKTENMFIEGKEGFMPFLYTNEGIFYKALEPIIGEFNLYKVFAFVDASVLIMAIMLFYFIIKDKLENKLLKYILTCIACIIFVLGYPLNSMLTGFHYLQAGINAILLAIVIMGEKEISKTWKILLTSMANICIIFTYNLFAPLLFIIEYIYILKQSYNSEKKVITTYTILQTLIAFVIPGICAILYFLVFRGSQNEGLGLLADGFTLRNKITNIVFFIPFTLYYFIKSIKNKEFDFSFIFVLGVLLYTLLFIGLYFINKISSYYYFKIYYLIWPAIIMASTYGICMFAEKSIIKIFRNQNI